jgi:hypothetical protein
MNGNPTRIPVLEDLDDLEGNGHIVLRKDKPNSAKYRIYLNEDDYTSTLFQELSSFKESYVGLIRASKNVFDVYEDKIRKADQEVHWPFIEKMLKPEEELLEGLFSIYIFVVKFYSVIKIFQWHRNLSDPELISNLHRMAFNALEEIQVKMFDLHKSLFIFGEYKDAEIFYGMFRHDDVPDLRFFSKIYRLFQRLDLEKEFEPLMDLLWKISYELIPFQGYREVLNLKNKDTGDWKTILTAYIRKFGLGRHTWMK